MSPDSIRRVVGKLRGDRCGAILVFVAMVLTVVLGFAGLGVETGMWYSIKRHEQTAADYAALSGAIEYAAGQPYYVAANGSVAAKGICELARRDAVRNGFTVDTSFACPDVSPGCTDPAAGQMCVNNPPVLGSLAGNANAVEVILARQQNTLLASVFLPSVTIKSRAVADVKAAGSACSLATWDKPTSSPGGTAVNFSGTTTDLNGCGVASNSPGSKSINFQGNATIDASWFQTTGNYNTNGNSVTFPPDLPLLTDTAPVPDPYSASCSPPIACAGTIEWPTISGSEKTQPGTAGVLTPGTYKGQGSNAPLSFTTGTWTLCPGVYVLDGEDNQDSAFSVSGGTVQMGTAGSGGCPNNGLDGVTIIATSKTGTSGGGFSVTGGTVTLKAPTSSPATGIPSGLIFAQDPAHADTKINGNGKEADSTITAGGTSLLQGTMYTPKTNVTFTGNSNSSCFIIIANTVTFTGTSTISGSLDACKAVGVTTPTVLNVVMSE